MELSPLEIRSQKFSRKIKGYDVTEVNNFLEIVSKDLEKLYGEYYSLKEDLVKKNQEITDYKEKDKSISEAILMVQSVSNDIKKTAIAEAEAIKKIAASEAEKIVSGANRKYLEIANNINDLLNKRLIIINSVKNLLSTNIDLINREMDKNMEVSFPPENIKIDISESISNIKTTSADNTAENENGTAHTAGQINKSEPDLNLDFDGFSENTDISKQHDNPANDNNAEKKEKDLAELLGDINKFSI